MKELIEKSNDLKEQAEKIVATAKAENRAVTKEEKENFDNIMNEIEDIENTIEMEEKVNKMEVKEVKVEDKVVMSQEEKDIKSFANVLRNGIKNEASQMTKGDNGAIIPTTIVKKIMDKVAEISPLFARATKYYEKGTLIIPKVNASEDDVQVTYVQEFSELEEKSNKFATITLTGFLTGGLVKISKSLLKNTDFELVQFAIDRLALKYKSFVEKEGFYGTTNKIVGISGSYDTTAMKVVLASKSAITSDELIDIQETVPDVYQPSSAWYMSRATRKAIRKLRDGQGNYLLNQVFNKDWDYELLGKPVFSSENIKNLGQVDTNVIFYGDASGLAFKISEDFEVNVLLEKYATQHAIGVCGYAELDSKIENTQKIAVATTPAA